VARGVIAKALEHLWNKVKRIDVVYVCSNGDIARQNINRLRVLSGEGAGMRSATRLTLLASQLASLGDVNFIALTPGTSFDLGTNLGAASERALLYWLLKEAWGFSSHAGPLNLMRGNAGRDPFRDRVKDSRPDEKVLGAVTERFSDALAKKAGLREEFSALCELYSHDRKHIPQDERHRRSQFVGQVRAVLALTCVNALNPDLVILDEFQRFKHLMSDEDDASILARTMFDYSDEHGDAKVMLLSATPYKMLTLASQGDDEDHYRDFLDTVRFLQPDRAKFAGLEQSINAFRLELLRLRTGGAIEKLLAAKAEVEQGLRQVMVRTERLASTSDRSGMLSEHAVPLQLQSRDVEAYVSAQSLSSLIGERDVMEYWKSTPYVMNFLEGYKLRDGLKKAATDPGLSGRFAAEISARPQHLLSVQAVRNLDAVPVANARLRGVLAETVDQGAWQMLWVPPAMPYYQLGGPYADRARTRFTKQLIFSAWRMVPRAVATLLSHAADHRAITAFESLRGRPTAGSTRWPTQLLRFQREGGERLTGMPLFTLLYPSIALAKLDPMQFAAEALRTDVHLPEREQLLARFEVEVEKQLGTVPQASASGGAPDDNWYWVAPLLLDLAENQDRTTAWLRQRRLAAIWSGLAETESEDDTAHWDTHVERLVTAANGSLKLGPRPKDLARVLAEAAAGSPAVVAYRALRRLIGESDSETSILLRNAAASIAWAMRNLFNLPESIAILRGTAESEPYWRRVLQYCVDGGLQAVLDEYFHMLRESLGLVGATSGETIDEVTEAVRGALGIRPGAVGVDEIRVDAKEPGVQITTSRLRSRFAMPFADARPEDPGAGAGGEGEITRMEKVRDAFNSPFWPFVLVSTSVGQEGLDFHPYCHTVVHWNLPSNPVDLEQREGRVHRYKGHAVRKNIAQVYGKQALRTLQQDPWATVFELGRKARDVAASDMIPYWVFPVEGGARIERRVPALPLSRELLRMADLRRTLAVYRVVFGQPRQEDLIQFLTSRFEGDELKRVCTDLRVDLSPH